MLSFQLSVYEIALFIGGFSLCLGLVKIIGDLTDRRGRRHRRYHRRRNHADDDYYDNDYTDDHEGISLGGWLLIITLLVFGAIALFNKYAPADGSKSWQIFKVGSARTDTLPTKTPAKQTIFDEVPELGLNEEFPETPGDTTETVVTDEPQMESPTEFYIQTNVSNYSPGIEDACKRLKKQGFSVYTTPKGDATAILVGPYTTEREANLVNTTRKLNGIVVSF